MLGFTTTFIRGVANAHKQHAAQTLRKVVKVYDMPSEVTLLIHTPLFE